MSKQGATPRRVWRVSAAAPQGEYVDSTSGESRVDEPRRDAVSEVPETSWMQSSLDLAQGLDVIDRTDSLSSELFGRWFGG